MILLKNLFNIYLIKKMINKDFKRRRNFLVRKIEDNSIVFLFSGLEKSRNNDVNYKFFEKYHVVGWMKLFSEKMCETYS